MTRENAKKRLEVLLKCMDCPEDKQCYDSYLHSTCEYTDYCDETPISEAVKVAIKALEQEPKKGSWILDETDNSITCNKCGCLIWANDIHDGEAYYCPNCGAKMDE